MASQTTTILVHEWVTGGGMAGLTLPTSWAAEGQAMRRAIAREFAALDPGRIRVIVTLDARLNDDAAPWSIARVHAGENRERIVQLARDADLTVLIAPETTGILAGLTREIQETGTRLLGSSVEAVELAGDKTAMAGHLSRRGFRTPGCRVIGPDEALPKDAIYPAVIKPIDGAGGMDTFFVECADGLPGSVRRIDRAIMQPYVIGQAMSASFLIDSGGRAWLLGVGEQDVVIRGGRFQYQGGQIPAATQVDERPLRAAVESVRGLAGFVGLDFIWDERRKLATILEINPRPTTSIVGLTHFLPAGRLAAAWIGALEPGSSGEAFVPELAENIRRQPPVAFDVTGAILDPGGVG